MLKTRYPTSYFKTEELKKTGFGHLTDKQFCRYDNRPSHTQNIEGLQDQLNDKTKNIEERFVSISIVI